MGVPLGVLPFLKKDQFAALALSHDWSREIATHDPNYYKWDQWLFLQLLKNKLAYRKKALGNWCPKCKTTLANEDVKQGKFHIWAISKIEEGIEILTGVRTGKCRKDGSYTPDSIFDLVQKQILEYTKNAKKFSKEVDKILKDSKENGDEE